MLDRLDSRALERIRGPSWSAIRPCVEAVHEHLIAVSPSSFGELTTIYVKYLSPETRPRPYAVLWLKKSTEVTLGLSLADVPDGLSAAPAGHNYAGLNGYLVLHPGDPIPAQLQFWAKEAYQHALAARSP
ncbi:MAG TPA: hypothetical protein VFW87_10585 [Pirellulales bacterium]|nr:hypothetical protein [Pirellulales bacterium]